MNPLFNTRRYLIPFSSRQLPHVCTDTLVIGLGVAGLRAALAACEHGNVIILSKAHHDCSNTAWAQGGIASVLSDADSFALHEHDTHVAGAGLCDEYAVRAIVRKGPEHLSELLRWGMRYDTDKKQLISFTPLPHFTGDAWQGEADWPNKSLHYLRLTATGGHVGIDHDHAAVRTIG